MSTLLPMWRCHKVVRAIKIATTRPIPNGDADLIPEDESYSPIEVDSQWMREKRVYPPGYYVVYDDGYTSWSPVEAFEQGYTRIQDST